jgi:hypothetical protein
MKYILSTLKKMALREAENQDPKLSLGVGVMSNFGRTHSFLIKNVYLSQEDIDGFLHSIISTGESHVSAVVCVTSEGQIAYPPRGLCTALKGIDDKNWDAQIFCPAEDGEAKTVYLSTLLRSL